MFFEINIVLLYLLTVEKTVKLFLELPAGCASVNVLSSLLSSGSGTIRMK